MLKNFIKLFVPKFVLSWYHFNLAMLADLVYGSPSKKLVVIGVVGTNGKSTTANLISKILEQAGHKTAVSSTVNFKIGDDDKLNNLKMTMPGRFFLQSMLAQAVKKGCEFAIIESSSEGILQHRQIGIHYDALVFTNLTPEHLEAHGGFENYKKAKLEYFSHLEKMQRKTIFGQAVEKTIIANADDLYCKEFTNFNVDQIITFGNNPEANMIGTGLISSERGIQFAVRDTKFDLKLTGLFNFYNALAATAVASAFGIDLETSKQALEKIENVPGRMESINEGQNFKVLIDYAPEPESLRQLYATVKSWNHNKIIHVLGSTGGGRDKARRKILGEMSAENTDFVIITNEDPYNDDPQTIIDEVSLGAISKGKTLDQNLFKILDRKQAIAKAFSLANANDLVLITGKGAEQKMAVKNSYIPWDDREVAREELKKIRVKQKK